MPHQTSGDYGKEDTPVPISNTEVKLFSADDSELETACENMSSPDFYYIKISNKIF